MCRSVTRLCRPKAAAQDDGDHRDDAEAVEDGADDEERREDRGVPAGQLADRVEHGDAAVDRDDERHAEDADEPVDLPPARPVYGGATPAEREHAIEHAAQAGGRAIAHAGKVGDQAEVPEQHRDEQIDGDGEDVPLQRAAELRPHAQHVRIREQPQEEERPAEVDDRKQAGADHRKYRHRLGEAVEGITPGGADHQQQRRDQGPGAADGNPPDVVDDGEAPVDRDVDPPDADAAQEQPADRNHQQAAQGTADQDADPPVPAVGRV